MNFLLLIKPPKGISESANDLEPFILRMREKIIRNYL
jgi:hypothetical protein